MKKLLTLLFMMLTFVTTSWADKGVVLVLSGGGVKGIAHIGVLQELEKAGIRPVGIVGTSIGSIMGGLYACGYSADDLAAITRSMNMTALITDEVDQTLSRPSSGQTTPVGGFRPELYLDEHFRVAGPLGLFSANRFLTFLSQLTARHPEEDFLHLPIPFAAVATDMETGEKVVLTKGNLAGAMRASMSLPGVFDPWEMDGRLLVDGGVVSNLPVKTAQELFPGMPVIAVDVSSDLFERDDIRSLTDVFNQTITLMTRQNVAIEAPLADLHLPLHVPEYSLLTNPPVDELIELGRQRALEVIDTIKALAIDLPPAQEQVITKGKVHSVRVRGLSPELDEDFSRQLHRTWVGKDFNVVTLGKAVDRLRARDDVKTVTMRVSPVAGTEDLDVTFDVVKYPRHRLGINFFGSTLSGRGWINLSDHSTDLFTKGDVLRTRLWLSDDWALQGVYQGGDLSESPWISTAVASYFTLQPRRISPWVGEKVQWTRYGITAEKSFALTPWANLSLGASADYVTPRGGHWQGSENSSSFYWGPLMRLSVAWQNSFQDPTFGLGFEASVQMPVSTAKPIGQVVVHSGAKLFKDYRVEATGGYTHGDIASSPYLGAYLGLKGELYSYLERPIAADRFAWGRLSFGRILTTTAIGDVDAQIFVAKGIAWDDGGAVLRSPWEAGLLLTAPKKLMNAQAFAVYNQEREWKVGITIGQNDLSPFLPR